MNAQVSQDIGSADYIITVRINPSEFGIGRIDLTAALNDAAAEVAKQYVQENTTSILEALTPTAIANLAIAESAKIVRQQFIDPKKNNKKESN